MRILSRRGSLLLSAICLAAFLFFLSVALTITNREDIRSNLLADHQLRAQLAVEGTLQDRVQRMRKFSDWEGQSQDLSFNSGATAHVDSSRFLTYGVQLQVKALSNLVQQERRLLLEEFRLADSVAQSGKKPHLFAIKQVNNALTWSVLGPDFHWQNLGALSARALPASYSAAGGSLFGQNAGEGATPPQLQDWHPTTDSQGVVHSGSFSATSQQLTQGNGALLARLNNSQFSLEMLPDPGETLGRVTQATINGSPDGQPTYATVTLGGQLVQLDTSEYRGPSAEWYSLVGPAAAAQGEVYYCHARHYYFRGVRFRNSASANPPGSQNGSGFYDEPCLLKWENKAWTKVVDLLKVSDDLSEPEIVQGPRPDPSSLWVTASGSVYCKQLGQEMLLQVAGNAFSAVQPINGKGLCYGDELLWLQQGSLSAHDPSGFFPKNLPAHNVGARCNIPGLNLTLTEEPALELKWSVATPATAAAKDLYAVVTCQATSRKALGHFDGQGWQLLPHGLAEVLPDSLYTLEARRDYAGQTFSLDEVVGLALGAYTTDQPLLRRYVPLARY